ncbi:MAG: recombination protein RecR [Candidatus Kaiserbacteria bacterium]|nr:MAG: recombination protein RecR [Candidatus Kaiserbacteria bacterium]
MDPIERLAAIFERFPGIGPRQAGRFVQFLLRASPSVRKDLIDSIASLSKGVKLCPQCFRHFVGAEKICSLCVATRDDSLLAVVASDADLAALEGSGMFKGRYFVLGGTISLASEKLKGLRVQQLLETLRSREALKEIVLAFPANPEGDITAIRIKEELASVAAERDVKITSLGRGLSTGSELEYADPDTIKSALEGRH